MNLQEPNINLLVLAVLVKRAGGTVAVTEAEVQAISLETMFEKVVQGPDHAWTMHLQLAPQVMNG